MPQFNEYPNSPAILDDDILLFAQSTNQALRGIKAKDLKAYINSGVVSTPTLPTPLTGYVKWFRGDSVTLFGNEVEAIRDKLPNPNDLTSISTKPTYLIDGINSKNVIRFNNSPLKTQPESYAAKTIYLVFRNTQASFNEYRSYICYRTSSSNLTPVSNEGLIISGLPSSNNIFCSEATNVYYDNVQANLTNYQNYLVGISVGAVGQFHLLESVVSNSAIGTKNLCFGSDSFSTSRALLNTDIAECIIYPFVLTAEQRTTMSTYFKQMYNFSFL